MKILQSISYFVLLFFDIGYIWRFKTVYMFSGLLLENTLARKQ